MKKINSLINVNEYIDNLLTLIYSQNDVFDGTLSYLYYKVLNMIPSKHLRFEEEEGNCFTEEELEEMDENFQKFEEWKFNPVIKKELKEVIIFIRKTATKDKILKKFGDCYLIEKYYKYNSNYLIKCIYKYYKKKKEKRR